MSGNIFGIQFRLVSFGSSHGPAIGGVIEGCPAGLTVDLEAVQMELDRRRPGSTPLGTARKESDNVEWLSGLLDGVTLGTPIAFLMRNTDARSGDYDHLKEVYRPGHADRTWEQKYGLRDHRGGGRASARETAVRVAAGAIARQFLRTVGVEVGACVTGVGEERTRIPIDGMDLSRTYESAVRCPDPEAAGRMTALIERVRAEGDTLGGMISAIATGVPPGLGEPVFDKLHADLGKAMLSINAVKGFQIGSGFSAATMRGSAHNDAYQAGAEGITTATNRAGGVQGGISTGAPILFDVAFKPVSTLMRSQDSVDKEGRAVTLEGRGRHDPCVVPRAVPIVEAMTCLVLADHLLRQRNARL